MKFSKITLILTDIDSTLWHQFPCEQKEFEISRKFYNFDILKNQKFGSVTLSYAPDCISVLIFSYLRNL